MRIITKSNCCGCCSLGTGTTIIAIVGLIESLGGIISYFLPILNFLDPVIHGNVILSASIIHLVICVLLIVSVNQQQSILAIPWLFETLFAGVAGFGFSIFLLSINFSPDFTIVGVILFMIFGWHAYFWFVVFHFYRELEFAEEIRKTAAESNENRTISVASGQSSLPGQNQAKTQESEVVTIAW